MLRKSIFSVQFSLSFHWHAVLFFVLFLGFFQSAQAGDIDQIWHEIETTHFRITYHDPLGKVVQRLAVVAERAHSILTPIMKHVPTFRTEVVLTDDVDLPNGSATAIPYTTMRLYVSAPDHRSELADYDDWLLELFVHEYTHILHLDTVNGLPKWINRILGLGINNIYTVNQFQPRWFIEGFAVFEETERTSGGRLRNTMFDMYLRMQTLDHRFLRLDQVTNETHLFPWGNTPYLYGAYFVRYLTKRYGQNLLSDLSHRYGGCWKSPLCWVPFFMSTALKNVTKDHLTYGDLYKDFRQEMETRYQTQKEQLEKQGLTKSQSLTTFQVNIDRPAFSTDGKDLFWIASPIYSRAGIHRYNFANKTTITELVIDGTGGLSLSPSGNFAVMSRTNIFRANYNYDDLILYQRDRHRWFYLSDGLRTTNPAISPDGKMVAFEVNTQGTRRLGLLPLPAPEIKQSEINPESVPVPEVWKAHAYASVTFPLHEKDFEQIYTPTWSPDGKLLAFSMWKEGGYRDIYTYSLQSQEVLRITEDRAIDMSPTFSLDGQYLYFVSDRTGIYNLFAYDLNGHTLYQVSNVLSGVFSPAISPDGKHCAYVSFVADGYRLEQMEIDPTKFWPAPPPPNDRPELNPVPNANQPLEVHSYNAARTLFRSALTLLSLKVPFLSSPGPYGQTIGFLLPMQDVVGLHQLSFGLIFAFSRIDATEAILNYQYNGLWNSIFIQASRSLSPTAGWETSFGIHPYDQESWSVFLGTSFPLLRDVSRSVTLSLSYQLIYTRNLSPFPSLDPFEILFDSPQTGWYANLRTDFVYSDARRFLYSIGPEQGRTLRLSMALANPAWGSEFQVYTFQGSFTQYVKIPWPFSWAKNHVLVLSYHGGYSMGDSTYRTTFSIGGFPDILSVLQNLISGQFIGPSALRGYAPNSFFGNQMHVLNVEYRFPILWIERGYSTWPFYLSRLHGAIYLDYGGAFLGDFSFDKLNLGIGAELRLDASIAYFLPFTLQLGYAHGFMRSGQDQVYFLIGQRF